MDRDTVVSAVIALLAVLAIALGAATLDPVETGGSPGPSHGEGEGIDDGDEVQPGGVSGFNQSLNQSGEGGSLPPVVDRLLLAIAVVAALLALYWLYRQASPRTFAGIVAGGVLLAIVVYVLLQIGGFTFIHRNGTNGTGRVGLPSGTGGGGSGENSGILPAYSSLLVLVVFGAIVIGGAIVALRSADQDTDEIEPVPEATGDGEVAAIGRAAGRAADRIDDADDASNEVYRAWEEMTDLLDVANPRASTPGEFATAADEAGMRREDVTRLTDLFRGTRYGGHEITDGRESRAVAALRRIEEEYTADETYDRPTDDSP